MRTSVFTPLSLALLAPASAAAVIPGWAALMIAASIAGHTSWRKLRRS